MAMMRRGSQRSMAPFGDVFDLLQEDPWMALERWSRQSLPTMPSLDMRETDDAYVVDVEMPGIKPEDIEVTLDGRTLMVRGRYGEERDDEIEQGRWLVRERRTGTYARAITLPSQVDPERIETSFENGELRIHLPKAAESRARRIPIQAGAGGARQVGTGEGRATGGTSGGGGSHASGSTQRSGGETGSHGQQGTGSQSR